MPDERDLDQILDAALAQHEVGRLDLAEAGYRIVLQQDPHEPDALNLLGVILQERGDLNEAIALITRALDIVPDFPEALVNLARARRVAGAPAAAAEAARQAIALDPEVPEGHLQLGRALLDLGDDAGAVSALRRATTLAPQSMDALLQLGAAQLRSNKHEAAATTLTAALVLDPNRTDARIGLARTLTDIARARSVAGEAEAAVTAARRAVELDPGSPDAHVQLGFALLALRDDAEAIGVLRRATTMAPDSLETHVALATALGRQKDHESAIEAWEAALTLKPDDPDLLIDFAVSLGELERFDEALAAFRQADALRPAHPRIQHGIALCLVNTDRVTAAADVCRQALEIAPDMAALWTLLANCEANLGQFDAAANHYRRSLALAPQAADVLHDLIAVGERFDDTAKAEAQKRLADSTQPARDRIAAGFALGKVNDRDGAYDEAFEAYVLANRLQRGEHEARGFAFDRANFRHLVDRLIANVGPRTFADTAGWGDSSELPVFIVGMPRSGTTLVEQIAASHPLVFGAGERKDIHGLLTILGGDQAGWSPAVWDPAAIRRETTAHLRHLRDLGGEAIRVIDKLPLNILFLGHIAALFPRARIVVCRRDPRDVCLSCFFQYFQDDTMAWADDLADCGFRAREIARLMEHWRKVLPSRLLEIQYETLVGNLEGESRRLIDFLGLEWDPACLSFHETERAVQTASRWQVRQPLYASSVGRWRHYRRHLEPLLAELAGLVPHDEDEDADAIATDPARALAIAVPHHQAGRLDPAEAIYRALLRRDPDDPTALHLLGVLQTDRGMPTEAVGLITRSLALRPGDGQALTNLARAYRTAGDPGAAIEAAQRAVAVDPDLPEAHVHLGCALFAEQDYPRAIEVLRRATELVPASSEAWITLAAALSCRNDHAAAAEAWEVALALQPDDPDLLINRAGSLGEIERFDEALAAYRQAAALAPGDRRAHHGIITALIHTGDVIAAGDVCRQVLEASPDWPEIWLLLGYCETTQGHSDAAAKAYRRVLALDPGSAHALHHLVIMGENLDDDAAKEAARTVLDDPSEPVRSRVAAGFALGWASDRRGAYDEAFEAYALANRMLRGEHAAQGHAFDRNRFRDLVDWSIATFRPQTFVDMAGWGDSSESPVFIVGMPRSGTSLVEQIAASHPLIFGGGEQKEIIGILTALGGELTARPPTEWDRAAVRRETKAYLERLHSLGGGATRITDKLPDNILCLGQIAVLFPQARIVVCRRDPRDVGLSCFFQYFRDDSLVWADDLADIGFRARQIDRLTAHWRKVLPCPVLEIQYETLVANLESESRRLIDFLGLDWDPACLSFHKTDRPVLTASHWQVRQPLYTSSVGRWRHHQHHLGPLLRELEGVVPAGDCS
jgi:tetratricopeptide (TPR) repeat protein